MKKPGSKTWEQLRCGLQGVVQWLVAVDYVLRPGGETHGSPNATDLSSATEQKSEKHERAAPMLRLRQVVLTVLVFGPLYGLVMGSYTFVSGEREFTDQLYQMVYSGIKVPLLLAITVIVSLPSFFVINTLLGLRDDFRDVLRAIVSAQAGLALILASLLPITLFIYVSVDPQAAGYQTAVLFNALMFGLASVASQLLLAQYYRPLVRENPRHRVMMRVWIFVYAFVGIQAGYCLRPFIGSPQKDISFLRDGPLENAYVKVWSLANEVFSQWF